ncbi:CoA-binding protein [Candidatus Woesearchaeota archaeon]|nr:CoA-binding protein [Candidatus Woesearchaeota archaeon]
MNPSSLEPFFHAKRIAIIGASRESGKIGNTILKQLLGKGLNLYPVNPNAEDILGLKCYPSILDIKDTVELAVIATPGQTVPALLDQLGKKKIRHAIIISAGFKETGNQKLEKDLQDKLKGNNVLAIGPNCLGVFDAHTKLDTLFLPKERLMRPKAGTISFLTQSGATGSAILDLAAYSNYGFAKFVSYGNAANLDETDLLEYLISDPDTKIICMYVEGIKRGREFLEIARASKKPILAIKGGTTEAGSRAAQSHTGSLAGSAEIYFGAFNQAGIVTAHSIEELFDYMRIFEKTKQKPAGKRVQIITNGGGYGILTADACVRNGLSLPTPGKSVKALKKEFPSTVTVGNPIDLLGDATVERYRLALEAAIEDDASDSIIVLALTQVPLLNEQLVEVVREANNKSHKPIVLVTTGSEYAQHLKKKFEDTGIACYDFPENAARALAAYVKFWTRK